MRDGTGRKKWYDLLQITQHETRGRKFRGSITSDGVSLCLNFQKVLLSTLAAAPTKHDYLGGITVAARMIRGMPDLFVHGQMVIIIQQAMCLYSILVVCLGMRSVYRKGLSWALLRLWETYIYCLPFSSNMKDL